MFFPTKKVMGNELRAKFLKAKFQGCFWQVPRCCTHRAATLFSAVMGSVLVGCEVPKTQHITE